MNIQEVCDIIHEIAYGFERNALECLSTHSGDMVEAIREQIYSGQNGDGEYLSPSYYTDPFFEQKGRWYHRQQGYIDWKYDITPPEASAILGLPPRPEDVPNLYINGLFHSEITATLQGDILEVDYGMGNGSAIVAKYGKSLLNPGDAAVEYFNREYMWPSIEKFFNDCGYR